MTRLLVLRPEPGAAATVARAQALGLEAVSAPLFAINACAWDPADPAAHDAVMLTSANAVRHAGAALMLYHRLPVYAVGASTAAAARAAGFGDIQSGPGDAAALLAVMAAKGVTRPLHLTGEAHTDSRHPGIAITRRIVYSADPIASLPTIAQTAIAAGSIVLLHSSAAAALLATLVRDRAGVAIAAISQAAADAAGEGWRAKAIAATANDAALLAAAQSIG